MVQRDKRLKDSPLVSGWTPVGREQQQLESSEKNMRLYMWLPKEDI